MLITGKKHKNSKKKIHESLQKFMKFFILFNDLWCNYKAISASINSLLAQKVLENFSKFHGFFKKLMAFSILFNNPWGNYTASNAIINVLITEKLQ